MRLGTWVWVMMMGAMALTAGAQTNDPLGYAVIVQQSPANGGSVTPGAGVLKVGVGQTITLSATPNPGFRFAYWLGDVASASASETAVNVDSPKMIIAVFERDDFEEPLSAGAGMSGGGGSGGLRSSPSGVTSGDGMTSGTGAPLQTFGLPSLPTTPDFFDDDFPVPGDDDDIVVPGDGDQVPEPTTLLLLGLGAAALLHKRQ